MIPNEEKPELTLEEQNEAFWAKTPEERAIAIAKDVLAQLEIKKYRAANNGYVQMFAKDPSTLSGDIQKDFDNYSICEVCVLGATILSCARLGDRIMREEVRGGSVENSVAQLLSTIFDGRTLFIMESCFEGLSYASGNSRIARDNGLFLERLTNEEEIAITTFRDRYHMPKMKMVAIMENIIANNGKFVL
jgi:hypothetical protein